MTWILLKHEIRALFADRLVWVITLTLAVTLGYGVWVGAKAVDRHDATVALAEEADATKMAALREAMAGVSSGAPLPSNFQDPRRPFVTGRAGGATHAILPVAGFQMSAVGRLDLVSPAVLVSLDGAEVGGGQEEIENPVHLLSGPLDLAFVVTFLLPLLALAMSFDLLSREKEMGTLGLLLSQPIHPRRLIWMKALARWGVLVALTVGATGLWLLALGGLNLSGLALWSGIVAVYTAFWVGLASVVNVSGGTSPRNAMILAFSWLILAVAVPSSVQVVASLLHPVPPRAEWVALEREEFSQVQEEAAEVLASFYQEHPEMAPEGSIDVVDFQTRSFALQEEARRRMEPVRERHRAQRSAQQALIQQLRWASPVTVTWDLLIDLAGTGDARLAHFEAEVRGHYERWHDFFAPRIYADQRLSDVDLESMPSWGFDEEPRPVLLARLTSGILGMLALVGALGLAAWHRLGRRRDGAFLA
jgi:ABC-2 type transport system permease protein